MIIEKYARDIAIGDVLSGSGATISAVVPSHHGATVYIRATFHDGYTQVVTIPADTVIATFRANDAPGTPLGILRAAVARGVARGDSIAAVDSESC